jgi:hypothetical protein
VTCARPLHSRILLASAFAPLALAGPAGAQDPNAYPQGQYQGQYPQQYPNQPVQPQPYPGQQYPYPQQGYGNDPFGQVIDQLLGNRYSVTDRQAVHQCARAATAQAAAQFGGGYGGGYGGYNQPYGGYNQPYGYNQQYAYNRFRVTAITDVERRSYGLRIRGLMDSGRRYGYGYGGGYNNYPSGGGDLGFRCNVDYRGVVTNVHVEPVGGYRY